MSNKTTNKIAQDILKRLERYQPTIAQSRIGHITDLADGVARISGLHDISFNEMLEFKNGRKGVAINLEQDSIGAIILGEYLGLSENDEVAGTGRLLSIPVSDMLLGRVINPLGEPIDGKGGVKSKTEYPLEKIAPGVTSREPVTKPLQTGIKAIDSMIPIGRGQRELIIGDRGTGKTALVLDTIINQKHENVICIYVAIGQKTSRVAQFVNELEKNKAMGHTIIVAANASDPASFQYIAPYSGCAIAEYFMDQGKDVLVVYDDLSKHAWAWRQISLVLRRPSGREAYPGDIFYLHSRLLERACRVDEKHGGGSITALPIIETQAGDLSAYIPTNVISITDGQIYLEPDLFFSGIRPAINVGLSVSRVGGNAQEKAMKQVAGKMRLDLAQYRDLAAFAQFASDLDPVTRNQIERGARMTELLKQPQFAPMPVQEQVVLLWAGNNGYLDEIPVEKVSEYENKFLEYIRTVQAKILQEINKVKKIDENTEKLLKKAAEDFKKRF
ncbi:MAG: F0F1 ATP synthase subunit alpha [Patescibacteria group bacterium]|nr:F0F1 ATP synthase subunit alpha [Patescibacteria group bacterium]